MIVALAGLACALVGSRLPDSRGLMTIPVGIALVLCGALFAVELLRRDGGPYPVWVTRVCGRLLRMAGLSPPRGPMDR